MFGSEQIFPRETLKIIDCLRGIEALMQIRRRYLLIRILVMSLHKIEEYIDASLKAGADGYILKDALHKELRTAIRSVLAGKTYRGMQLAEYQTGTG